MQAMDILKYIEESDLNNEKKQISDGEYKVIFENENIKITLKKRGKKIYTFIDEYGDKSVNKALNEIVKLV